MHFKAYNQHIIKGSAISDNLISATITSSTHKDARARMQPNQILYFDCSLGSVKTWTDE